MHLYNVVILILLNFISIVYVFQTKVNLNCGNSKWQAARVYSGPTKNLRATGLVIGCCRHRVILKAANMYQPENYQHTHFVHSKMAKKIIVLLVAMSCVNINSLREDLLN